VKQNYNADDEEAMSRKPLELLSGSVVYIVLALFFAWAIKLHLPIIPIEVANWLGRSLDPQGALVYFCSASSALILALLHLGVEIPRIKVAVPENLKPYISGLPMWALGIALAISMFGFWLVYPSCEPPVTVEFTVSNSNTILHPSDTINLLPGESITITAHSVNDGTTLHCKWEYAGSVFEMLGAQNGCHVSTKFKEKPGNGFITVSVSEDFCSQSSVFSLRTIVTPP
jgi:hypothetical protein